MQTKIIWEQGVPCELPEEFDPFLILVWGGKDLLTVGSLSEPKSYKNDTVKSIINWFATEYLRFTLLDQNQDLSELRIKNYLYTGNWAIKLLCNQDLNFDVIDDFRPITKVFQETAAKTRSDIRNRSNDSTKGNRTEIGHIGNLYRFLSYLYPNDANLISDYLVLGKRIESIIEPPSEFCVVETVRYVANKVKSEETKVKECIVMLKGNNEITADDILLLFELSKDYRNLFLYLFIAITGINATNAMLVTFDDLSIRNDKKTSGKTVSVYKARANKVVTFEISKDVLIKYVNPFVDIFTSYNLLCDKFGIDFKLDYIGRQIFYEDKKYRHIAQYYLFLGWLKSFRLRFVSHINVRLGQENLSDHKVKIPTPSDLRNYKATAIESRRGHILSSIIMQHKVDTGSKYYLKRQEKEAIENLGVYYAGFENMIKNIGDKVSDRLTTIPAGKCRANDEQQSIIQLNTSKSAYVIGDCTTPTGCLFCSFFVVHADEEGIYKLISMREYIYLKNRIVSYEAEIENNYGAILDRINGILDHLKEKLSDIAIDWIKQAEDKVAFGLHPDWQELYDMDMALMDLAV